MLKVYTFSGSLATIQTSVSAHHLLSFCTHPISKISTTELTHFHFRSRGSRAAGWMQKRNGQRCPAGDKLWELTGLPGQAARGLLHIWSFKAGMLHIITCLKLWSWYMLQHLLDTHGAGRVITKLQVLPWCLPSPGIVLGHGISLVTIGRGCEMVLLVTTFQMRDLRCRQVKQFMKSENPTSYCFSNLVLAKVLRGENPYFILERREGGNPSRKCALQ